MFTQNELMDAKIEHLGADENQSPCKVTKASPELLEALNKKLGPIAKDKHLITQNEERFQMNLQKKTQERIVTKIIAGYSLTEISKELGVSRTTIAQVARMNGLAKKLQDNFKTGSPAEAEYRPTAEDMKEDTQKAEPIDAPESVGEPEAMEEPVEEPEELEKPVEDPEDIEKQDSPEEFNEVVKAPSLATEIVISTSKLSEKYALSYISARAVEAILSGDTLQAAEYLKV